MASNPWKLTVRSEWYWAAFIGSLVLGAVWFGLDWDNKTKEAR